MLLVTYCSYIHFELADKISKAVNGYFVTEDVKVFLQMNIDGLAACIQPHLRWFHENTRSNSRLLLILLYYHHPHDHHYQILKYAVVACYVFDATTSG
jgi:hypothetical protein